MVGAVVPRAVACDLPQAGEDVAGARDLVAQVAQVCLQGVVGGQAGLEFEKRAGDGLQRLRLSSIDSIEVDEPLMDAIASDHRLMPHLHLSLQSGDNMILKRMKRRHLRDDTIRFCNDVRTARPDAVFGADIIAGFPTETEAMFENSLSIIDEAGLTFLHVFPFSARQGTPAAKMPPTKAPMLVPAT